MSKRKTFHEFDHYLRIKRIIALAICDMAHPTLKFRDIEGNAEAIIARLNQNGYEFLFDEETQDAKTTLPGSATAQADEPERGAGAEVV